MFLDDCPCENYDCDRIKTRNNTILVVRSYGTTPIAQLLIDYDGKIRSKSI